MREPKWVTRQRYEERHRAERAERQRPLPFDDLDLSAWTVGLLREHLSPAQFERMRGVLARRVDDYLARRRR